MENTFDLKKFLVENKLTNNSRVLAEQEQLEEGWKDWVLGGLLTISTLAGGTKLYQLDQQAQQDKAKQTEYLQKVIDPVLGKMSDEQKSDLGAEINDKTHKYALAPGSDISPEQFSRTLGRYAEDYVKANPSYFGVTADGQVHLLQK